MMTGFATTLRELTQKEPIIVWSCAIGAVGMYSSVVVYVCAACMCVCVRERERDGRDEREREMVRVV